MSSSSGNSSSYPPLIPHQLYLSEKDNFAGFLIGAILYGVVITLSFQCISTLLNPVNRTKGGVKWGLVAHTALMFSLSTAFVGMNLDVQSISYIDNRNWPGNDEMGPGPVGYQYLLDSNAFTAANNFMWLAGQWLSDGLLMYRCFCIYSMSYWVIAFPFLMYLATIATSILITYTQRNSLYMTTLAGGISYYSISLSLNVLLTLMIVTRLILHSRNIRKAMGTRDRPVGSYLSTIVTILVESSALYAITFLLYIGPWRADSSVQYIFFPILAEVQVISPLLITLRVANRTALTSETIVSGNIGSIRFKSHVETTDVDGVVSDEDFTCSTAPPAESPTSDKSSSGAGIEKTPL